MDLRRHLLRYPWSVPQTRPARDLASTAGTAKQPANPYPVTFGFIEAKVLTPRSLGPTVPRTRLMRWIDTQHGSRLLVVTAPAGYGKTSTLVQWAMQDLRRTAWLTVDQQDNDPAAFLSYLAAALGRVLPLEPALFAAIESRAVSDRAIVGRLLGAIAAEPGPVRLAIDDVHRLRSAACRDSLAEFVTYLPENARVAIAGRDHIGLPLERWRLGGYVVDVGASDLAMDEQEASRLMSELGLELSGAEVAHLTAHTQGWPALLALALGATQRPDGIARLISPHASSEVSDYLRSELLEGHSDDEVAFLTRTSVMERLSGPLCDAVLDGSDSSERLTSLLGSSLLVDDYGDWYRCHPILREFLRDELDRREPGLAVELHRRAAQWHADAGELDIAVEHAFATDDLDFAALIVGRAYAHFHWSGRRTALRSWLRRFDDQDLSERPWLAVLAAYAEVSEGDVHTLERYASLAEHGTFEGRPPDGTVSLESGRHILRALMCRQGPAAMLADADLVVDLEAAEGGRWQDFALWLRAVARHTLGDLDGADRALAEASAVARAGGHEGLTYCILGHRAFLATERQDWGAAGALMEDASACTTPGRFDGYVGSALARVAVIRLAFHRGDFQSVSHELSRIAGLRPLLTAAAPTNSVLALLGLARLHLAMGDPAGARSLLVQADQVMRLRPDLGVLAAEAVTLRAAVASLPIGLAGASTLTAAELRVLAMLPYYLSFKEIGQRLGVKATTIKTHALSIYGKLGATSRSEAVDLAVDAGLLEPFPILGVGSAIREDAGLGD